VVHHPRHSGSCDDSTPFPEGELHITLRRDGKVLFGVHLSVDGPKHPGSARLATMTIPTEPIGSIPRPPELLQTAQAYSAGRVSADTLEQAYGLAGGHRWGAA
jgi:hypothetical protein